MTLQKLKEDFYQLFGLLSVDELTLNTELIKVIERLDRMLKAITP